MTFQGKTRFLVRTLIFIIIGAVAIVFTDLFVLNKKHGPDPYWWSHNVFTTLAYWSSNSNGVDVAALKSKHSYYMEEGIVIPKDAFDNITLTAKHPSKAAVINKTDRLSAIEPSVGIENKYPADDSSLTMSLNDVAPSVGLDALGLENEDIADIFSRRNVEDVVLSYGEVPEFRPRPRPASIPATLPVSEPTAELDKIEETIIAATDNTFEVYTHAPIEVKEDKYPDNTDEKNTYSYIGPEGNGKIAIIIDDMGLSLRSKLVEVLPAPLTLSYLPYAENLKERVHRAHSNGHEIMVHIPMEPLNSKLDAGPHVLTVSQSKEELLDTLDWGLSQFDGYVGINNHMGSKITADKRAMDEVMANLKTRKLFFVDSRTIGSSVAAQSARETGIPYGVRDIFLDHEVTSEFIQGALTKLENKAATRGYAIAIGHPHKETINALKEWLPTLKDKGLTLVPVSELLQYPLDENAQAKLD